jgi:hypothetical protein
MVMSGHAQPRYQPGSLIKVWLRAATWRSDVDERVWAERFSDSRARLLNVPYYAYDASFGDCLDLRSAQGELEATRVTIRSGHSTYRFFVQERRMASAMSCYWPTLEALGCTYERATEHLFAVDVPPEADIHAVHQALETGEEDGAWEFEEGHCDHVKGSS